MKAHLMHPDRDFDPDKIPVYADDLIRDLALDTLLGGMAADDGFLRKIARAALLAGCDNDAETVCYRQAVLQDCLQHRTVVEELYRFTVETLDAKRDHHYGVFGHYPPAILHGAIDVLRMFVERLRKLKVIADAHASTFRSPGFKRFFDTLKTELSDEYLHSIQHHLKEGRLKSGVLISARLGEGNRGKDPVLRELRDKRPRWIRLLMDPGSRAYSFRIPERDEAGARALSELEARGINLIANALAQSMDHINDFFTMLRTELAFYVACLRLYDRLKALNVPLCFPGIDAVGTRRLSFTGLSDVCLALQSGRAVVGNTLDLDGKDVAIITGANQGGKSSFLRSIGLAQLMLQSGMFVAAGSYTGERCKALLTHYRREEDASMKSGKLDEELNRMSRLVDAMSPDWFVLFNESFASTNEREGSEIARQIVGALQERRIRVFFVTHLYAFAHGLYETATAQVQFLRAERQDDGTRTFRITPGEPLQTSYGKDLYFETFAGTDDTLKDVSGT
ncbi:DNA mismatch repair protein MutS [Paraburkholderia sp. CNPSo 3157]|uniref:DNA mismatch repair protein MutS n=1 Tax=Paraburkholderia franconis TaxID=2654983 RepID=A0A7X1NDT2_9BURK|nr:DNA mismatch repair protein MutS [Paraburkholderia franconis]MPW20014.1 DNA mismatch repair protein MutS [Paraburkholderia franconis]